MGVITIYGQRLLPKSWRPVGAGIYWWGLRNYCPVCGWHTRSFRPLKVNPTFKERCTRCGALSRHRFLWLYLMNRTNLFRDRLKVLHFAPEPCFSVHFSKFSNLDYTTADVDGGYTPGMEKLDLMSIEKPANSYDVVLAIHVLEHVEDDAKAIREVYRVLKPGGWAILNPHMDLSMEKTFEDPTVTSPEERERLFHQDDHYRVYGRDLRDRFEAGGFNVKVENYMESLDQRTIEKSFLDTPGAVFFCKKPC
jgi:SAM-dependent methyltransferase